jgi:hypothetical protein
MPAKTKLAYGASQTPKLRGISGIRNRLKTDTGNRKEPILLLLNKVKTIFRDLPEICFYFSLAVIFPMVEA